MRAATTSLSFPILRSAVRSASLAALAAAVAASVIGPVPGAGAQEILPTGFALEAVAFASFGSEPTGFAFLPDGRVLLVERSSGNVRLSAVGLVSSVVIYTVPDVVNGGERGLTGIAVDPGWPARPYIYFFHSHASGNSWISMVTASGDLTDPSSLGLSFASPFALITDIQDKLEIHQGGTLRFGPDGMLFASVGDDAYGCRAQNLNHPIGKMLRLDVSAMPDSGSGPPPKADLIPGDNPFGGSESTELIWAWGLRNPFRFTIDDLTGDIFLGDVGSNRFEEINRIDYGAGAGENFGWPIKEGPDSTGSGQTCGLGNAFTDPIYSYSRVLFEPLAVVAGPRVRHVPGSPLSLPAAYDGSVFLLDYFEGWIRRLVPGPGGWEIAAPVAGQPSPSNWAEGFGGHTDFQVNPDGALYVCRFAIAFPRQEGIYRIVPAGVTDAGAVGEAVDEMAAGLPSRVIARPNPVRGSGTTITWSAGGSASGRGSAGNAEAGAGVGSAGAELEITDVSGRRVRRMPARATGGSGPASIFWDGRNRHGRPVPAGTYFLRLRVEGETVATGSLVVLR